jgi:hypothetical protein
MNNQFPPGTNQQMPGLDFKIEQQRETLHGLILSF